MATTEWKTITVPKGVYLPTVGQGAFKDSGLRVEPTDKIEVLPGSALMRVNGSEHTLMISTDSLRLDAKNCVILDKPAPMVGSLGTGDGYSSARVGRSGSARFPTFADAEVSPIGFGPGRQASGPQMHFDDDMELLKDPAKLTDLADIDPATFAEEAIIREITLKDGSKAFVYIDPNTGRPCSAPFRQYSGIGINPDEAMRLMAEQNGSAVSVAGKDARPNLDAPSLAPPWHPAPPPGPEGYPATVRVVTPPHPNPYAASANQPPQATLAATSGNPNLDGFIGMATKTGAQGFPLGQVTCISAPPHILTDLQEGQAPCTSLEAAFARIHLAKTPTVFVRFPEELTTSLRLELADQLPTLSEVLQKHGQVALVLLCPASWPQMPTLLTFIPTLILAITPHVTNDRFWTVTCTKGSSTGNQPTASFPA